MSTRSPINQSTATPRIVHVRQNILRRNDELAQGLGDADGSVLVSLVSSPGSGEDGLFGEKHLRWLQADGSTKPAALVGNLATDNDAKAPAWRIARPP